VPNFLAFVAGRRWSLALLLGKDGHVLATIEDDGPGFDPEEAARSGRLGLLGGTLEVESEPGSGTTIYARLPVAFTSYQAG
jgi:signal transduction histidine kinase